MLLAYNGEIIVLIGGVMYLRRHVSLDFCEYPLSTTVGSYAIGSFGNLHLTFCLLRVMLGK
jgi:hypothetical protein